MGNFKNSTWGMVTVLGAIGAIAGLLLGLVYMVTKEPIEQAALRTRIDAIAAVVPQFDNNPLDEAVEVEVEGNRLKVYPARKDGELVGAAVASRSLNGFSGEIEVMYGFDADGVVSGFEVLSQAETPGLGAKMNEWFRDKRGHRSVIGVDVKSAGGDGVTSASTRSDSHLKVTKDGGTVDGITAATISSRAFLEALNLAFDAFETFKTDSNER